MQTTGKLRLLFYNKFWKTDYGEGLKPLFPEITVYTDPNKICQSDVVIFHIPSLELTASELASLKSQKQIWVFFSLECLLNYPQYDTEEVKELFEITMTYEYSSDIPVPYINSYVDWRKSPDQKTKLVNAFISNQWNSSNRIEYLAGMLKYIKVDSFGLVLNNCKLENDDYRDSYSPNKKMETISRYKFTIAFENSISRDYVTEKFFQPLIAGSVPIYLGAPNILDFAPSKKCFIDINDFASPPELCEYLVFLDKHEKTYLTYLNWKERPFNREFIKKLNENNDNPISRLIHHIRSNYHF